MKNEIRLEEKKLYKEVTKVHLSTEMQNKPPKGKDHAIKELDTGNLLAFCSEDYKLKRNAELYKPFEQSLKQNGIEFKKQILIFDSTKFYVDYILNIKIKSNLFHEVLPMISIWNSYDGTVKTQIKFRYHVEECYNKLTRPCHCNIHISLKHSAEESKEDFLKLTMEFIKENIAKDIRIFEKMYKKKADISVIEKIIAGLKLSKESRQMAVADFTKHNLNNMFGVYNAINYAIYNSNIKELPEVKLKKDTMSMEHILKLM